MMRLMMRRILYALVLLVASAAVSPAFQAVAYIPFYRIDPAHGAENALGRQSKDAAPDAWDGSIAADSIRMLPSRWDDASWRLRILRDYDEYILHIPMDADFISRITPTVGQLDFLRRLKEDRPDSGIRLSLLGHSTDFLPVCSNETRRQNFAAYLSALCLYAGLDGIDLDWEFTSAPRDDEVQAITALAADLQDMLPEDTILSAAVSRWRLPGIEFFAALDAVHLMAYDGYGKHSTYEGAVADAGIVMARMKVPQENMVLGIPFYGRIFDPASEEYFIGTSQYREIIEEFNPPPDSDEAGGYFYNGEATVAAKTEWAKENGLRGVFVWEPFYDLNGSRSLSAIIREIADREEPAVSADTEEAE